MSNTVGVIDYGVGNLASVVHAVDAAGGKPVLISNPSELQLFDSLILPGVGAFGSVGDAFRMSGFWNPVLKAAKDGVPLLGICVGMQMLFETSTEFGLHKGLALIPGKVELISREPGVNDKDWRLPVIGWFRTDELDEGMRGYYFLHSYAAQPSFKDVIVQTYTYHKVSIVASVQQDNVMGTQFHPERSGEDGIKLLSRFVQLKSLL